MLAYCWGESKQTAVNFTLKDNTATTSLARTACEIFANQSINAGPEEVGLGLTISLRDAAGHCAHKQPKMVNFLPWIGHLGFRAPQTDESEKCTQLINAVLCIV